MNFLIFLKYHEIRIEMSEANLDVSGISDGCKDLLRVQQRFQRHSLSNACSRSCMLCDVLGPVVLHYLIVQAARMLVNSGAAASGACQALGRLGPALKVFLSQLFPCFCSSFVQFCAKVLLLTAFKVILL